MGIDRDRVGELVARWTEGADRTETTEASDHAAASTDRAETGGEAAASDPRGVNPDVLTGVRDDADGFAFTRRLLEALAGAEDPFAAALGFRDAAKHLPASLPGRDRLAVRAGWMASLGLPWAVLPIARRFMRDRLAHLVLAARTPVEASRDGQLAELRAALTNNSEAGFVTVMQPIGEPVLGPAAAQTELDRLIGLTSEPAVTHLAVDPERILPGTDWGFDADADRAAELLRPLFIAARDTDTVISFIPSSYRGARLAPELIVRGIASAELDPLRAGIHLSAELPESRAWLERLIRWSAQRVADGGAPLELTITTGSIAAGERIRSLHSGLPVPTLDGRTEQSAQWLRLVELLLDATAVSTGLPQLLPIAATEDPHLLAAAIEMARERGIDERLGLQLRSGTAPLLAQRVRDEGVSTRLLLPLTAPDEFSGAVELLLRLASEAAEEGSALAAAQGLADLETMSEVERERFAAAAELAEEPFPASHRVQSRAREWNPSERDSALFYRPPSDTERYDTGGLTAAVLGLHRGADGDVHVEAHGPGLRLPHVSESGFANEPDTDPAVTENRAWLRGLLTRAAEARTAATRDDAADAVDDVTAESANANDMAPVIELDEMLAAAAPWRSLVPRERATRLRRLALGAAAARDRLIVELAVETGAPVHLLDAEVNGAIDASRYLADLADGLGAQRGAEFRPDPLALLVIEAGAPLAERAEALLAILAAGSAAVVLVAPETIASTRALLEEWEAAGLPEALVAVHGLSDSSEAIVTDQRIRRALVLGSREAARRLIRRRPDVHVDGRFRSAGTIVIAPSANPGEAAHDAAQSAFGAGMSDPRSARVVITVGSAARSVKLRKQLADAVRGIRAGDSAAPGDADPLSFDFGPLATAPDEVGLRALTELEAGEEWLVAPEQLDEAGRLWQPGVRIGVRRDARFWNDASGMPVIGVVAARSHADALELQRELGGGSVAALHTSAVSDLAPWLESAPAAALTVNRATTPGAIERRPGGGWGRAGMGVETLAGGPNRLVTLGTWKLRTGSRSSTLHLRGLDPEVRLLIEAAQSSLDYESFDRVRRAALSDALSWRTTLGRLRDEIGLGIERNLLRYEPMAAQIRLAEGGQLSGLVRVLAAALLVRAPVTVSSGEVLPREVAEVLASQGILVSLERDQDWLERIAVESGAGTGIGAGSRSDDGEQEGAIAPAVTAHRVRLIGGDPVRTAEWLGGQDRVSVWADPVTMAGPVELLAFLHEQAISVRTHRYGLISPPPGLDEWIAELDARSVPPA